MTIFNCVFVTERSIFQLPIFRVSPMSAISYQTFIQDFRYQKDLGKGNCATVQQIYHSVGRKSYALKRIECLSTDDVIQAINEGEVIHAIDDKNLTQIHFYYLKQKGKDGKFELGLIMDLCDTNLTQLIKERKNLKKHFKPSEIKTFLVSIVPLLAKMQKRGYLHRDIKPDNILISTIKDELHFKLADFGFGIKSNCYSSRNIAGTMEYVSPKLVPKFKNNQISVPGHTIKDDVYSLGKTLVQMMTLQMGHMLSNNQLQKCKERYGKQLFQPLELMLRQDQNRRIDFVELLEQYFNEKKIEEKVIIQNDNRNLSVTSSNSHQAGFTKKQMDRTPTIQINHLNFKNYPTINTRHDYMTKRKTTQGSIETNVQVKLEQQYPHNPTHPPTQIHKWSDINKMVSRKTKLRQEVTCLTTNQHLLFIGLECTLGVMIIETQKLIMFPYEQIQRILYLKLTQDGERLIIGTIHGSVFIVSVIDINKFVIKNNKSFAVKNTLEIPFQSLSYSQIKLEHPVSYITTLMNARNQFSFIAGHCTGDITMISAGRITSRIHLLSQPITCLVVKQSTLYASSANGIFKRQDTSSLGILIKPKVFSATKFTLNYYKCVTTIVTFEIIADCKRNKDIAKPEQQYLAAIISYDGFLHIVSKNMTCEKMMRVCPSTTVTATLNINPDCLLGFDALIVDENGSLCNQQGKLLRQLQQKQLSCMATSPTKIFLGTFTKTLLTLYHSKGTIELD